MPPFILSLTWNSYFPEDGKRVSPADAEDVVVGSEDILRFILERSLRCWVDHANGPQNVTTMSAAGVEAVRRGGTPFARLAARFRTTDCRNGRSAVVDGMLLLRSLLLLETLALAAKSLHFLAVLVAVVAGTFEGMMMMVVRRREKKEIRDG